MRGLLKNVIGPIGPKVWSVQLLESLPLWHDLLYERLHPDLDSRAEAVRRVKELRLAQEAYFDRRCIYFICSRPRVRFAASRPARISDSGDLRLWLDVGRDSELVECSVPVPVAGGHDSGGSIPAVAVENTPKRITFDFGAGRKMTLCVHDFIQMCGIQLGHHSQVRYIGYTKRADVRVIEGEHSGLTRVLARTREEYTDIFVYFNVFSVRALATNEAMNAQFIVSNAMSDEVDIKTEGLVLEKLFIQHFKPDCQGDLGGEHAQLRRLLTKLATEHDIVRVDVSYAVENAEDDYFVLGSVTVEPAPEHTFTLDTDPRPAP